MSEGERKNTLAGEFGNMLIMGLTTHVTWIFWTSKDFSVSQILGQGSAFIANLEHGAVLITAAHVYRAYLSDLEKHTNLYCQVANTTVRDLRHLLIACGDENGPDIATFKLNKGDVNRIGITPVQFADNRLSTLKPLDSVGIVGFPGVSRQFTSHNEIDFTVYPIMPSVTSVTDHQITCRFERDYWVSVLDSPIPRPGYDLGGMSGGPLLFPHFQNGKWEWRLAGVISQSPSGRPENEVLFESIVAHRADYITSNGTLALSL